MNEFKEKFGMDSWIVGDVIEGDRNAYLAKDVKHTEC